MAAPLPRFEPIDVGQRIIAEDYAALQRAVAGQLPSLMPNSIDTPGGLVQRQDNPPGFWAKITGKEREAPTGTQTTGTWHYAWQAKRFDQDGNAIDSDPVFSGTTTTLWAIEVTNAEAQVNDVVWLTPSSGGVGWYEFHLGGGGGSCTGQVTVVTGVCISQDNTVNSVQTADYQMTLMDHNVDVDATAGPVTVWLPPSNLVTSHEFTVQKTDASGNVVSVVRGDFAAITGGQDGTARSKVIGLLLDSQYAAVTLFKQVSGPEAGEVMTAFPLILYGAPAPVLRTKNTVGGSGTTAMPSPGMVLTAFPLMTY